MRKTGTGKRAFLATAMAVACAGLAVAGPAGAAPEAAPAATRPATAPATASASAFAPGAVAELLGNRLVMWQRGAPALAPAEEGQRPAPPPVARPANARVDTKRALRDARRAGRDRVPEVAARGAGEVPSLAPGAAPVRPERPRLAEARRFASVGLTPGPLRIPIAAASGRNRLAAAVAAAGAAPAVVGPLVGDEHGASTFPMLTPFTREWSERLARSGAGEDALAMQEGDDDDGAADGLPAPSEDEAGIRLVPVGRDLPLRAPLK